MHDIWLWLLAGFIPYSLKKQQEGHDQILEVRAIFWSLMIHRRRSGRRAWAIHIPLIEHLRE
jgi:hypothetical protein